MKQILISPSILNADFSHLEEECISLEQSGADWVHCDVMDGVFVPNKALCPKDVAKIKHVVDMPLDVHLMVQNPIKSVAEYVEAGAKIITFHLEADSDVRETAELIHDFGAKAGLSVKPATSVERLLPFADFFDMILIMTVEPGFGGQKFIFDCLEKIRKARKLFPNKIIEVDGGINADTAALATEAGADVLVSGSFLLNSANRKQALADLRKACKS